MKIFADTANLREIEEALKRGFVRGITTNPSLLAQEQKINYLVHLARIVELLNKYKDSCSYRGADKEDGIHLSVEVFSRNVEEIIQQAKEFRERLGYRYLSIKVQIGWDELEAIMKLSKAGLSVNCTCCMSVTQALMAVEAGARYVSFFWGRIRDGGREQKFVRQRQDLLARGVLVGADFNPAAVVGKTRKLLNVSSSKVEIIVGSIRSVSDICAAGVAGAHIVTVPPKFFPDTIRHFKTDEVVGQFFTDFQKWMN